jgi:hypothetical protein
MKQKKLLLRYIKQCFPEKQSQVFNESFHNVYFLTSVNYFMSSEQLILFAQLLLKCNISLKLITGNITHQARVLDGIIMSPVWNLSRNKPTSAAKQREYKNGASFYANGKVTLYIQS